MTGEDILSPSSERSTRFYVYNSEPDTDGEYLISEDVRREHGLDYIYQWSFSRTKKVYLHIYLLPFTSPDCSGYYQYSSGIDLLTPHSNSKRFGSRYSGMVRLEAKGLPDTIKFDAPVFPANQPSIIATFSTPKDTPLGTALVELIPYAADGNIRLKGALAQTHELNDQRGGFAPIYNKTRKLGIGILKSPFDVRIEQPSIGLAKGAELGLKVIVERKEGFGKTSVWKMDWLRVESPSNHPRQFPERETVGYYTISATSKSTSGEYKLTITARENKGGNSRGGVGYHYIASPFITVEIMDPYLSIELVRTAYQAGKSGYWSARSSTYAPSQAKPPPRYFAYRMESNSPLLPPSSPVLTP